MKNLEIIKQLLEGNHLEEKELKEAKSLLSTLNTELESRFPRKIDFTRVNSDSNGNPRYVCHFLDLLTEEEQRDNSINNGYDLAIKKAKKIGGRKFHNKQYGGGIVFQSYNLEDTEKAIRELLK